MKIAIFSKHLNKEEINLVISIINKLKKYNITPVLHNNIFRQLKAIHNKDLHENIFNDYHELKKIGANFLFSIGGDGTILKAITLIRNSNIPVMGINIGRLGFLSTISTAEIDKAIKSILNNQYFLDKRALMKITTPLKEFSSLNFALNDITIHKSDTFSMIVIHTFLDKEFLNSYWSDGLIIATPTGSTAYSMSCGGPILFPRTNDFVLTPIAPHNLNARPIVIPDNKIIKLKVESRSNKFSVSLDSRTIHINTNFEIKISKADFNISILRLNEQSFLKTLKNKLMWGIDKRN